jgi:hypothetical protein
MRSRPFRCFQFSSAIALVFVVISPAILRAQASTEGQAQAPTDSAPATTPDSTTVPSADESGSAKPATKKKRKRSKPSGEEGAQAATVPALAAPSTATDKPAEDATTAKTESSPSPVNEVINALDYPELQVVPRASDRLRFEAREEQASWYFTHWQIRISGLATMGTALMSSGYSQPDLNTNDKALASSTATVGTAVGGAWLIAGFLIGMQKPYASGIEKISKIKGKDDRSTLLRERLAEEALARPASTMRPLKWASVATNCAVSAAMGVYMTDRGRLIAGLSAFLAFLPMFYEDRNIEVYDRHLDYKRKIYRPFTMLDLHLDQANKPTPMARMIWDF